MNCFPSNFKRVFFVLFFFSFFYSFLLMFDGLNIDEVEKRRKVWFVSIRLFGGFEEIERVGG